MRWLDSLADVLLPRYCKVCGERLTLGEQHLCASCYLKLPRMPYSRDRLCITERLLLAEKSVVRAASFFHYEKESKYVNLLYHLKYYGHPEVGRYLARAAATALQKEGFFEGIECIVPVPLSKKKLRKRGYNQCDYIARGLSEITGIPVETHALSRNVAGQVQASKGRFQRWNNAEGLFCVADATLLQDRFILLCDDVVTTGATISSLTTIMEQSAPGIRIAVFTLAIAT